MTIVFGRKRSDAFEAHRRLAVEEPLPPVARDELGEHHGDRTVVRLVDRVDVLQEGREERPEGRLDDIEGDVAPEPLPAALKVRGAFGR